MKSLVYAVALLASPATEAGRVQNQDNWWECIHFFQSGEGEAKLQGRLDRRVDASGAAWSESYQIWGAGFRTGWQLAETPGGTRRRVSTLSIEVDPIFSKDGQAITGYLYGDDQLVLSTTILSAKSARRGFAASGAYFWGPDLEARMDNYDHWRFVAKRADGSEVARRSLAIPDRRERDRLFVLHRAAIEAAWRDRDEKLLVSRTVDSLPRAPATCLFSTPDARAEMQDSEI